MPSAPNAPPPALRAKPSGLPSIPADAPASALATRQRILNGAALLFSEHGYAHGSIRNITSTCGIKGPSFYHHFRSKEEMTIALLQEAAALACAEIGKIPASAYTGDPKSLLDAAIDAHLRAYFDPDRMLAALVRIYRQLPPDLFLATRQALRPLRNQWVEIIRTASGNRFPDPTQAKAISLFLFGAMNAMADWQERPGFAMPLPALRQLFADVIFRGLRG
jgi:AcrR family transcriptional regulator